MSREIKFRAWDLERKEMFIPDLVGGDDGKAWEHGYTHEPADPIDRKHIFMQFTGLHDKNGIEIYEGDIMRGSIVPKIIVFYRGSFNEKYYDATKFGTPLHDFTDEYFEKSAEVIGNIYENPELLDE